MLCLVQQRFCLIAVLNTCISTHPAALDGVNFIKWETPIWSQKPGQIKENIPGVTKECFLEALKYFKTSKQHPAIETPGAKTIGYPSNSHPPTRLPPPCSACSALADAKLWPWKCSVHPAGSSQQWDLRRRRRSGEVANKKGRLFQRVSQRENYQKKTCVTCDSFFFQKGVEKHMTWHHCASCGLFNIKSPHQAARKDPLRRDLRWPCWGENLSFTSGWSMMLNGFHKQK